jgi:hypothetical protein
LWRQFDGYRVRDGEDFEVTTVTRPFLEDAIRERVAALPNVRMLSGVDARGVLVRDHQVEGVVLGIPRGRQTPPEAMLPRLALLPLLRIPQWVRTGLCGNATGLWTPLCPNFGY